jgi:hypothetical protein
LSSVSEEETGIFRGLYKDEQTGTTGGSVNSYGLMKTLNGVANIFLFSLYTMKAPSGIFLTG